MSLTTKQEAYKNSIDSVNDPLLPRYEQDAAATALRMETFTCEACGHVQRSKRTVDPPPPPPTTTQYEDQLAAEAKGAKKSVFRRGEAKAQDFLSKNLPITDLRTFT